jgi:sterol 3beta-glucosyltransferase
MKITILTYGSRGDVQPFIPLSIGLMARGHSVKLTAPARFKNQIEDSRITFVPLAGDPAELSKQLNDSGNNFLRMINALMHHAIGIGIDVMQETERACSDAELIIHTFMHAVGGHTLARERDIPDVHVQLFPMFSPTGDYPNVTLPDLKLRSANRFTHSISRRITVWGAKIGFEQIRRRAGLPKQKLYSPFDRDPVRPPTPILCTWSPHVLPTSKDWPSNVHATGYLFGKFDSTYQPPIELQRFLDSGDPPVCVSFGSMMNRDAQKIDQIVSESLRQTNHRGIILFGWSEVKKESLNNILYLDSVPHQWLLPHCQLIIHHGGAGTTSAGLRAGIPNIVIPFTADQPFWGNRVYAIGAGPKPISVKKLSVANLTQAILEADDPLLRKRAQLIGQELKYEQGVETAIWFIEKYSNEFFR